MPLPVQLEPEARAFAEATTKPPYLFNLNPEVGRRAVDQLQSRPIDKPAVEIRETTVLGKAWGDVPVRIVRPEGDAGPMLHARADTGAAHAAIGLATSWLREGFAESR